MHRLFVAIRPPETIRDILIDAMDEEPVFRWQSDEQLHLTLRFIGEVDRHQATDIADALSAIRTPPFSLRLSGLGCFDHKNGGALWAGIEPADAVSALAAKVERACQSAGLEPSHRAYRPHITIARWSGRRGHEARTFLSGRSVASEPFMVDSFGLFESHLSRHGSTYEEAEHFRLA